MFKALRRLISTIAVVALFAAAIKSAFNWVARSDEGSHELFVDEDEFDLAEDN